jgi:hypothetical protein
MSQGKRESAGNDEMLWAAAAPLLAGPGVERGTMMGSACVRVHGEFAAMVHVKTGELILKLSEPRVIALAAAGAGERFAPNGRVFREWLAVPVVRFDQWSALIGEAVALARKK